MEKMSRLLALALALALTCATLTGCMPMLMWSAMQDDDADEQRTDQRRDRDDVLDGSRRGQNGDAENPDDGSGRGSHHDEDGHHGTLNGNGANGVGSFIPGTYEVPEGWALAPAHCTQDKLFYCEDGQQDAARPDNVSVNVGTNRYAASDHVAFREAILRQLSAQMGDSAVDIQGSGQFTDAGDVLYVLTVREADSTTTFCYVVGDYRFCLFQATDFNGSDDAADAAEDMAESFVWDAVVS